MESVGDCENSYLQYPFEDYDQEHAEYLEHIVLQYTEHMYYFERGIIGGIDFLSNNVDDEYNQNMYCMSWFYGGCYPYDQWEENYDNWLYELVCSDAESGQ